MPRYSGKNGVLYTKQLFFEWGNQDAPFSMRDTGDEPFYKARSGKEYQSLPWLYRNSISEYECAIAALGSWEHWKKLCGIKWFQTGVINGSPFSGLDMWREEKQIADASEAKKVILEAIKTGDLQAAKFLFDKTLKKENNPKGRPNKKQETETKSTVLDLAKRIQAK